MDIRKEIEKILFDIGTTITVHKIDNDNSVIEINYEKYVDDFINLFNQLDAHKPSQEY